MGDPMQALAGTQCSGSQSATGCNQNATVGAACWTGGVMNSGVKGTCGGPYVMESPNASTPPVNNALCTCKTL